MAASTGLLTESPRVSSIDLMRGIVMVVMALDHTRDFFHLTAFQWDPEDLIRTNAPLFFTRWITHFCAPTFVLLSGTSVRLSLQKKSKKEVSRFLWTRGLWLIFLELTVIRFGIFFNLYYDATVIQVIYTIGSSMIILSALIFASEKIIFIFALLITFGHNVLDSIQVGPEHPLFQVWTFLFQGGFDAIVPGKFLLVKYPTMPWFGTMLLGYSLGAWYAKGFDPARRKKLLLITGLGAIALFIVLRWINVYGDPAPWSTQKNAIFTLISFLNCTKYPVSLLYILMTLGPILVILSLLENVSLTKLKPVEVFGRVPMFYYVIHFYFIHILSVAAFLIIRHKTFADLDFHFPGGYFGGTPITAGYSLRWVYVVWIAVVLILYPLCKKYSAYKITHRQWWLSYL
jgi:uncharacterized membrane protein